MRNIILVVIILALATVVHSRELTDTWETPIEGYRTENVKIGFMKYRKEYFITLPIMMINVPIRVERGADFDGDYFDITYSYTYNRCSAVIYMYVRIHEKRKTIIRVESNFTSIMVDGSKYYIEGASTKYGNTVWSNNDMRTILNADTVNLFNYKTYLPNNVLESIKYIYYGKFSTIPSLTFREVTHEVTEYGSVVCFNNAQSRISSKDWYSLMTKLENAEKLFKK